MGTRHASRLTMRTGDEGLRMLLVLLLGLCVLVGWLLIREVGSSSSLRTGQPPEASGAVAPGL